MSQAGAQGTAGAGVAWAASAAQATDLVIGRYRNVGKAEEDVAFLASIAILHRVACWPQHVLEALWVCFSLEPFVMRVSVMI